MNNFVNDSAATDNQQVGYFFEQICAHQRGEETRKKPVNDLIRHLSDAGVLDRWAHSLARRYYLQDMVEDVAQIVATAVVEYAMTATEQDVKRIQALYLPHLFSQARVAVMKYQESGEHTGIASYTQVVRRKKQIVKTRNELMSEGVMNPSERDIMDRQHANAYAARKDPARQGILVKEEDFRADAPLELDGFENPDGVLVDNSHNYVEVKVEMDEAVRALVWHLRLTYPGDDTLLVVSNAWMRATYQGESTAATRISEETGVPLPAAKDCLSRLHSQLPEFRRVNRPELSRA